MIQVTAICVSGYCEPMRVVFATFMHIVLYSQTSQITFIFTTLTLPFPIGFGAFLFSVLFNHSLASVRIFLNSTDLVLHCTNFIVLHQFSSLGCSSAYNCISPSVLLTCLQLYRSICPFLSLFSPSSFFHLL